MDKKTIGVAGIYVLIMLPLLLLTYGANWNPSNISYELNGDTLVILEGIGKEEVAEVNVEDRMNDLLQFTLAVSVENKQWSTDVWVIGLLLPFLLFAIVPDRRPFKKKSIIQVVLDDCFGYPSSICGLFHSESCRSVEGSA
ncbi:hypothetical protein LC065_06855 [Halobacillus litoralis]|uniref:hypothetical protein n=1 Tax=Halobacillus litoralis TaxID=45668 RepID=UPI00273FF6D4|nr:hypothetical protein [Halobacillus litoralis]WLR48883.1 hypothetical protein LC065_06855 [Halobacillus litoralis]